MGQKVTIGGDRLGSGNKQKEYLHDYHRSTHDLSQKFASSLAPGILYPFLVLPATRGDHFEIDMAAAARTIPTKGPLFGSYKMQVDIFQCPVRLYQGILHNNPLAIGLKMSQVKLPKLKVESGHTGNVGFSTSCLLKHCGMSGLGRIKNNVSNKFRNILAVPALAYYDIFKNYYANKQEEYAYYCTQDRVVTKPETKIETCLNNQDDELPMMHWDSSDGLLNALVGAEKIVGKYGVANQISSDNDYGYVYFSPNVSGDYDTYQGIKERIVDSMYVMLGKDGILGKSRGIFKVTDLLSKNMMTATYLDDPAEQSFALAIDTTAEGWGNAFSTWPEYDTIIYAWDQNNAEYEQRIQLKTFKLSNIDDMRMSLLSYHTLGTPYIIDKTAAEPYKSLCDVDADGKSLNEYKHNGLVVKTYQADIFNAWINTDWIDGENGISEITKVAVSDGGIYIDSLILARKLFDMLNRVAISGGTYEEWQDAVYTESPTRHIESPLYLGGMSSEVVFEEIIQNAPANIDGEKSTLGTLGGRGTLVKRKGGSVDVKCDEACFIIGIVSLTPRVFYTQGNEFYMTELDSLDDFHKPALDGIGFQDLIGERLAYFDTLIGENGVVEQRSKIGKVPAWQEYMTAVDKAYGDFAEIDGKGFMILNRNYEQAGGGGIKDATTYIDPTKYNYAFAMTDLESQNFWVEISCYKLDARRLISAKQMPNL